MQNNQIFIKTNNNKKNVIHNHKKVFSLLLFISLFFISNLFIYNNVHSSEINKNSDITLYGLNPSLSYEEIIDIAISKKFQVFVPKEIPEKYFEIKEKAHPVNGKIVKVRSLKEDYKGYLFINRRETKDYHTALFNFTTIPGTNISEETIRAMDEALGRRINNLEFMYIQKQFADHDPRTGRQFKPDENNSMRIVIGLYTTNDNVKKILFIRYKGQYKDMMEVLTERYGSPEKSNNRNIVNSDFYLNDCYTYSLGNSIFTFIEGPVLNNTNRKDYRIALLYDKNTIVDFINQYTQYMKDKEEKRIIEGKENFQKYQEEQAKRKADM